MQFVIAAILLVLQTPGILHQSGSVTGVVKNRQGIPIPDTRVVLTPSDGDGIGTIEGLAKSDAEGKFRIDNIPAGSYHLAVGPVDKLIYHPGVEDPGRATIVRVANGLVTSVPVMVLSLSRVTGRIIDAKSGTGRSIESFVFSSGIEIFKPAMHQDGSFSLLVPPGTYVVIGNDPAVVPFAEFLTVPDGPLDELEFSASRLPEVRGTVGNKWGHPIAVKSIFLRADPANTYVDSNMAAHNKTSPVDSNGSFAFSGVIPGKYTLEISTNGARTITQSIQVGTESLDVRMVVPFGEVTGQTVP
jgi:hypothetical protein